MIKTMILIFLIICNKNLVYATSSKYAHLDVTMNSWVQQSFPQFELQPLNSERKITINNRALIGKITLVDFWASWCKPCERSLPLYFELKRQLSNSEFQIIAISLDDQKIKAENMSRKVVKDETTYYELKPKLKSKFDLKIMPMSYLVGRNSKILKVYSGFNEADLTQLKSDILKALNNEL